MSTPATRSQRVRLQPGRGCSSRNVATRPPLPVYPFKEVFLRCRPGNVGRDDAHQRRSAILSEMKRAADPYRDLDVIDSRAPRFNQATIGVLSAVAVATRSWGLLPVLARQLLGGP